MTRKKTTPKACTLPTNVRVYAGPQALVHGNVSLRASGPSTVVSITVIVHGAGGHVWSKTVKGHSVNLTENVANRTVFGAVNGTTYGPNDSVTFAFHTKCGSVIKTASLNNQDPPKV